MGQKSFRNDYMFDGSAVRKIEVEPERRKTPKTEQKRRLSAEDRERKAKRKKELVKKQARHDRALAFDLRYTVFVSASVLVIVAACVMMIYMNAKITSQKSDVADLKADLNALQVESTILEEKNNNMYSVEQIYDKAVGELGMTYARRGQIIYYEQADEDYVKQYQNVPEAN